MAFNLKRTLIIFAILMGIMQIIKGQEVDSVKSGEENQFSSEETAEDSKEFRKQRRRSAETSIENTERSEVQPKASLPAIPGLPDPETIQKIAEILTTVGQQVLPILVSGNSGASGVVSNLASHDMKFLKKFKNELDVFSGNFKKNK